MCVVGYVISQVLPAVTFVLSFHLALHLPFRVDSPMNEISWDSRTCYARRAFNRGLTDDCWLVCRAAGSSGTYVTSVPTVEDYCYVEDVLLIGNT